MPQAKVARTLYTVIEVLLVLAILVVANIVAEQFFVRVDLTEDKEYTISSSTKRILGDLDDVVSVKAYFSEELPPRLQQVRRRVGDILDEYRNYSHGRINVEWIDPAQDPEVEQQMRFLGIPQVQAQILEKDQLQVKNIYMGIAVQYGDKRHAIPVVQDTYSLEYELTSAILRVTMDEEKVIGFLTGFGVDMNQGFQSVRQLLGEQYEVRIVNLEDGGRPVPADVHTLVIPGPSGVTPRAKYEIDQFIMRGGRVIFLIDAIQLDETRGLQARPITSGLEDLLANYGVRVQKALVKDGRFNTHASFSTGFMQYSVPYPFWPKISGPFLARDQAPTSRLESLVLPWPAPLKLDVPVTNQDPLLAALGEEELPRAPELDGSDVITSAPDEPAAENPGEEENPDEEMEAAGAGEGDDGEDEGEDEGEAKAEVTAQILARTSPFSELQMGRYDLTPSTTNPFQSATAKVNKSFVVAAALEGSFDSYFADREVPGAGAGAEPDTAAAATKLVESPETQILVLGNSFFLQDNFLGQFPENGLFFQNVVDWLTLGPELIGIRSRGATDRPLQELSGTAKSTIKVIVTLGPALLVIAIGLIRLISRRRRRSAGEAALRSEAGRPAS
ncbi:MAG: hypothetical protein GF355_10260 [Candidatus Eisenbacteria bacterium]|nr:hypothetical protein [Candidatus Eisenbacteria bacterium]